ncbi:MAG: PD40 domain-containing protein [Planctomycetes bacterium]|nr:PD40 domain-containing protein [Planctomycetota bacterium]
MIRPTLVAVLLVIGGFVPARAQSHVTYLACESDREWIGTPCANPALSADGRYCALTSSANLLRSDVNNLHDVYVHDGVRRRTLRVTVSANLTETDGPSGRTAISMSADGGIVVYDSTATNLVPADTNGAADVFATDLVTGKTERISVSTTGSQADGPSFATAVSGDGRWAAFASDATNLVATDANGVRDVFLRDRTTGTTTRVSVDSAGREADGDSGRSGVAVSFDGRFIAFDSSASNLVAGDTNGQRDIFVHDRVTGVTELVTPGRSGPANGESRLPAISEDGRFVAFASEASNLTDTDRNRFADVFVRDRLEQRIERISETPTGVGGDRPSGEHAVAIAGDGMMVAFDSRALNLVPGYVGSGGSMPRVHVLDRRSRVMTGRTWYGGGYFYDRRASGLRGIACSRTGRTTAFWVVGEIQSRSWSGEYVMVHTLAPPPDPDPIGGAVDCVVTGNWQTPDVSPCGRYVVYAWGAPAQILLRDRWTGQTTTLSLNAANHPSNRDCSTPRFSPDGGYVAFESWGNNLVPNDTNERGDIFLKDLVGGTLSRVSLGNQGQQANASSGYPSLSTAARCVAFETTSANLVPGDTNGVTDIFVRDLGAGQVTRVSVSSQGAEGDDHCTRARISADGRYVVFQSRATNLVPCDTNRCADVFHHDRQTQVTQRVSVSSQGGEGDGDSDWPVVAAGGRWIVFQSAATNLVLGDTNQVDDIFIHDIQHGATSCLSVDASGLEVYGESYWPSLSPNGRWVTFTSKSSRLALYDMNFAPDLFVRDLARATIRCASVDSGGVPQGVGATPHIRAPLAPITDTGATVVPANGLCQRDLYPRVAAVGPTRLGATVTLALEAANDPGRAYCAAMAFDYQPGVPLTARTIPLAPDALTLLNFLAPGLFPGFRGVLDASGEARASFRFPGDPQLEGLNVFVACVVLDPSATDGVRGISNAVRIQATP